MRLLLRRTVLAIIVVAAAALAGCSGGPLQPADTVITARFENANGLFRGNAVSVLGMRVGEIAGIRPRGSGVDIDLRIDGSIPLPADVRAVALSDSVLTDRRIELTPPYRGGPELPEHAVLGAERTAVPVEFDSLLAMADKLTTALGGDGHGGGPVADVMGLGTAVTQDNGDRMRTALGELAAALRLGADDGAATRAALTTVVTDLDSLTALAARNDATLREFGSGIHQLADLLAGEGLGTGDTGARLNRILGAVTALLQQNQDKIAALAGNSGVLTTSLAAYNRNIAEFLDVFPLVTDNTYNAIDQNIGAVRATVDINRFLLDGQMVKEVCNLLHLTNLGCDTGTMRDMGPDFGITAILQALADAEGGR
ncbi:MlaD family protein [Nocardia sp. NPDC003963]